MVQYDILIRGGMVIDPASGTQEIQDIYVKDGRIVPPPAPGTDASAEKVIPAEGCIVTPGLIDAHLHLFESGSQLGGRADLVCPPNGVTTAIDAGSAGLYNFRAFYEHDVVPSTTTVLATLSTTKGGVQMQPYEEIADPCFAAYDMVAPLFARWPDTLVGLKQRVHADVTREFGLKTLEQAAQTSRRLREEGYRSRLMVHFGPLDKGIALEDVVSLLSEGDVMTHIYRPANGTTIFDEDGKVAECIHAARKRGVVFESGCARSHLSFDSIRKAFADGFPPEIISTDMIGKTFYWEPSGWLPLKMSIYLEAGMPLEEIIRAVTASPARVYGLEKQAGSLRIGQPADIAVLRLIDRERTLDDLYGGSMTLHRLFVPMATVKNGAVVYRQIFL